jgi:hypothetical protein
MTDIKVDDIWYTFPGCYRICDEKSPEGCVNIKDGKVRVYDYVSQEFKWLPLSPHRKKHHGL